MVATNAWAGALPELRRALVVVSSDIVATPPIPDRLAEIGWTGGEGITDSQMMVAYYRTTEDGADRVRQGHRRGHVRRPRRRPVRPRPRAARR